MDPVAIKNICFAEDPVLEGERQITNGQKFRSPCTWQRTQIKNSQNSTGKTVQLETTKDTNRHSSGGDIHTGDQRAHGKMLNITGHQGSESLNYNEVTPHTQQTAEINQQ